MKIIIGADVVPTESNFHLFSDGNAIELVGEKLYNIMREADFRIFNLEVPLSDVANPIKKRGPNLIAPEKTIAGLKVLGINLFTLANNHIMDHGEEAYLATCDVLKTADISYVGSGKTMEEAAKPYIFEFGDKKVGVYACTEHEFTVVTPQKCGANPFEALDSLDHIAELKKKCDFVITLYHGGKEHYRYPSPYLRRVCQAMSKKGSDLVICQHSHCIGCKEEYKGSTIIYGQGNFLFDRSNSEFWQTGMLISLNDNFDISYIPVRKVKNCVRLAEAEDAVEIMNQFYERSANVCKQGFIEQEYKQFARENIDYYLRVIAGKENKLMFRIINKLTGRRFVNYYNRKKYKEELLLALENYIECEAHRELLLEGIRSYTNQ